MNQPMKKEVGSVFRPTLKGCVARDLRMAQLVAESRWTLLCTIFTNVYRSLLMAEAYPAASRLLEELVDGEKALFSLLGDLVLALGGNRLSQTQLRIPVADLPSHAAEQSASRLLYDVLNEQKCLIDRFQTMMGRTGDRVVRSVLAQILADLHNQTEKISRFLQGE